MINQTMALSEKIASLQHQQEIELVSLKKQFYETYESLKPINLIKNTFSQVTASPEIKTNIVNNVFGFATGYLSKRILFKQTQNPLKRLVGDILQLAVMNVVSKYGNTFKSLGENLVIRLLDNHKESKKEHQNYHHDLFI
jgi:hypothetical protein